MSIYSYPVYDYFEKLYSEPGGSINQIQYNTGTGFGGFTVIGDGTLTPVTGDLIVTKTNGVSFGALAVKTTVDWPDIYLTAYGQVNVSGAASLDRTNGECQRISIVGNVTSLTISNFGIAGKLRKLVLEIWNTGDYTFTWPVGTIWPGGVPVTVTSGAGSKDLVVLLTVDGGTTIYGTVVGQSYA